MLPFTPLDGYPSDESEDEEGGGYIGFKYPAFKSPREALQPTIDKFRGLHWISRPLDVEADSEHYLVETEAFGYSVPDDATGGERNNLERLRVSWQASRDLKDLYLACGWDRDALQQTAFRREEFVEKRRQQLLNTRQATS